MVQFYPATTLFAYELTVCLKLNSQNAQISFLLKSSYSGQLNNVFAAKKSQFGLEKTLHSKVRALVRITVLI